MCFLISDLHTRMRIKLRIEEAEKGESIIAAQHHCSYCVPFNYVHLDAYEHPS